MSWPALLRLISDELGAAAAERVERRAKMELWGVRITVGARDPVSREEVERASPGRPREAARKLGISPATAYRALKQPLIR